MTYRRPKPCDSISYYDSPDPRTELVFYLINTARRELGLSACISPRITTVIQVVIDHEINYNCFNEPSAVSPYKLLILRLACLSLGDKHMTTGRINQVSNAVPAPSGPPEGDQHWRPGAYRIPRGGACR